MPLSVFTIESVARILVIAKDSGTIARKTGSPFVQFISLEISQATSSLTFSTLNSILETRYSRLDPRDSILDTIEDRVSSLESRGLRDCQLTFEWYCSSSYLFLGWDSEYFWVELCNHMFPYFIIQHYKEYLLELFQMLAISITQFHANQNKFTDTKTCTGAIKSCIFIRESCIEKGTTNLQIWKNSSGSKVVHLVYGFWKGHESI